MKHIKNLKKRSLALLLCAVVLGTALTGCGDKDGEQKESGNDTSASVSGTASGTAQSEDVFDENDYAVYNIAGATTAYPDTPWVLRYEWEGGSSSVNYDEFRYYQLLYKNHFDNGNDTYWETNPEQVEVVTELFHDEIIRNHAVMAECNAYGITLTEEEQKEIDWGVAELISSFGGKDTFDEALIQYYMTEWLYNYQSALSYFYEKLFEYYKENGQILNEDTEVRAMLEGDDFIRCKHILIMNDAGDDVAANRAQADDLLTRLQNGEDFDTLMNEYSEDTGLAGNPGGYYFFRGEMVAEFEDASFALAEGELSGVVESTYGYHIILRCEKEASYLDENLAEIKDSYQNLRFYKVLEEVSDGWTVVPSDTYDAVNTWAYAASVEGVAKAK